MGGVGDSNGTDEGSQLGSNPAASMEFPGGRPPALEGGQSPIGGISGRGIITANSLSALGIISFHPGKR